MDIRETYTDKSKGKHQRISSRRLSSDTTGFTYLNVSLLLTGVGGGGKTKRSERNHRKFLQEITSLVDKHISKNIREKLHCPLKELQSSIPCSAFCADVKTRNIIPLFLGDRTCTQCSWEGPFIHYPLALSVLEPSPSPTMPQNCPLKCFLLPLLGEQQQFTLL